MLKSELEKQLSDLRERYNQLYENYKTVVDKYDELDVAYGEEAQARGEYEKMFTGIFKTILEIPEVRKELMRVVEQNLDFDAIAEYTINEIAQRDYDRHIY